MLTAGYTLYAQDNNIKKEVFVVKPYEPAVSDAYKINDIPLIHDSITHIPSIEYFVLPVEMKTFFETRPVKPAKMLGVPVQKLYSHYLRAGMGNYASPMADIYINSLRDKYYNWGAHAGHASSFGKLKLDNDRKVPAGYHDTQLEAFGKRIYKNAVWSAKWQLNNNSVYQYGYTPSVDTILRRKDIRQTFTGMNAGTRYQSAYVADSSKIDYDIAADMETFGDRYHNAESSIWLSGDFSKYIKTNKLGLNSGYRKDFENTDSMEISYVRIQPYLSRSSNKWSAYIGIDYYFFRERNNTTPQFFPIGYLEYNVINHYVKPYIGVTGGYRINTYKMLSMENPYIIPDRRANTTINRLTMFGGVKGNFSPKISFNGKYSYGDIGQMYFFVNDSSVRLRNRFSIEQYEVEYSNYFGEIEYTYSPRLHFYMRGNMHKYKMYNNQKPWHKPAWDASFIVHYNLLDIVLVDAEITGMGKRYAKAFGYGAESIELKEILDFNIGFEYKYSKVLSAFLQLNNLTGSRYYIWHQYPSQRFNMMLGVAYAL